MTLNKRPAKTLLCVIRDRNGKSFDEQMVKSIVALEEMIERNGARHFDNLDDVVIFLNGEVIMGVTVRGKSIIFNIDIDSGVYISNMNIPDIIYKNKSRIVEIIFNINYSENIRKIMPNIEQNINSIIKNLIEGLSKLDITDITLILSFSENPSIRHW